VWLLNVLKCLSAFEILTLKNAGLRENFCACLKLFSPDQRSPPIPGDHRHSLALTQRSAGAILSAMGDYQRFLKRHRTLTSVMV
jgi:hypothetical protein